MFLFYVVFIAHTPRLDGQNFFLSGCFFGRGGGRIVFFFNHVSLLSYFV